MEERTVITYEQKPQAELETYRGDYTLSVPGTGMKFRLKRDEDFGLIRNKDGKATVRKPILFKQGADTVFRSFGVFTDFELLSSIERVEKDPLFFYSFKCIAYVLVGEDKKRVVVASGVGSANTSEKRNGFNGPFDAANNAMRMAKKRAYVDCAINLGYLSGAFTMDMENEDFMSKADEVVKLTDDSPVTTKQMRRLYALGADAGLTQQEIRQKIIAAGFTSTKDIKQKDYEKVCALFGKEEDK